MLLMIVICMLMAAGSGVVQVHLKGSKVGNGPLSIVLANTVTLVQNTLPWATDINLKRVKSQHGDSDYDNDHENQLRRDKEDYNRETEKNRRDYDDEERKSDDDHAKKASRAKEYEDKQSKLNERYAGLTHVILSGTVTGGGNKLEIIIDVDYLRDFINAITVIGPKGKVEIYRAVRLGPDNSVAIETKVLSAGTTNIVNNFSVWRNDASVSQQTTTTTGDLTSSGSYTTQGAGIWNAMVISDNYINQTSVTQLYNLPNTGWNDQRFRSGTKYWSLSERGSIPFVGGVLRGADD